MSDVDLSAPRPVRVGAFLAVAILHLLALGALIRAFAPDFATQAVERVVATFTVTISPPEPTPPPPAEVPAKAAAPAGQAGEAGKRATPREVLAPAPRIRIAQKPAPAATSTGSADTSGARDAGSGTGAGGTGSGTGAGGSGSGAGGGGGTKAVKIAGDINSARDYPVASREARIGDHVIIWLTVGTDGRPAGCRVARPSRDAEANAITCRLAMERFRFRPATDASGQPVVSTYGWQQRWFYPGAR